MGYAPYQDYPPSVTDEYWPVKKVNSDPNFRFLYETERTTLVSASKESTGE